jgi:cysteine desulfurase
MMNRYYLDYNATAPVSSAVMSWLKGADLFEYSMNPAGLYSSGRRARSILHQVERDLLAEVGLTETHQIIFHSGATEGINLFFRGFLSATDFFYSPLDHAALLGVQKFLKPSLKIHELPVLPSGDIDLAEWIQKISEQLDSVSVSVSVREGERHRPQGILNWTLVNNETGVIWPLEEARRLKEVFGDKLLIHVDAVQSPGRLKDYQKLDPTLDAYTYSGHKFGALKGVGMTFIKKELASQITSLMGGGEQQSGLRPGTENVMGAFSLKLAWGEWRENFNFSQLCAVKDQFESELIKIFGNDKNQMALIGEGARFRNLNTITLNFKSLRSESLLPLMDLNGLEVGLGSACSSGTTKPSRILMALGYQENESRGMIRISFSPFLKMSEVENMLGYFRHVKNVMSK